MGQEYFGKRPLALAVAAWLLHCLLTSFNFPLPSVKGVTGLGALLALHVSGIPPDGLNLDQPAENLRAFIKLLGSLDGKPVFDIVRGGVYGLSPGLAGEVPCQGNESIGSGLAELDAKPGPC